MPAKPGATMKSAIVKRSIVLGGHKTSVSLEKEFWDGLHAIADLQNLKLSALVQKIDLDRRNANLSSAIRIFVFNHYRAQGAGEQASAQERRIPTQLPTELASVR
jgi:predicted DNA-binding ribbon-helix-helix protein